MLKNSHYFTELASLFQVAAKIETVQEFKLNFFRVAVSLRVTYKGYMLTYSSFQGTCYFVFLRKRPFIKTLSNKSVSKLL